jgi:NTE family protein
LLASHTGALGEQAAKLADLWRNLRIDNVFVANGWSLLCRLFRIGLQLSIGSPLGISKVYGMVDTEPLRVFLHQALGSQDGSLPGIQENIDAGHLKAVALTTLSFGTGKTITFYQGKCEELRKKSRQRSVQTSLTIQHIMASSSLPLFFPPAQIENDWYGDGGIRLVNPLAPALESGADRILAISNHYLGEQTPLAAIDHPPSPATVMAAMYSAEFFDQLDYDVEEMRLINKLARELPAEKRHGMRDVKLMVIRPSQDISEMAYKLRHKLPKTLSYLMSRLGTNEIRSQEFLSTVMFETTYIEQLIQLGQRDAEWLAPRFKAFFET